MERDGLTLVDEEGSGQGLPQPKRKKPRVINGDDGSLSAYVVCKWELESLS
jgi:hypothetical protein